MAKGIECFVSKYGYPAKDGTPDRLNFGGIHKAGTIQANTGLTLQTRGVENDQIDLDGCICLIDKYDNIAAEWSFTKLLEHWTKKHAKASFVPYTRDKTTSEYSYGQKVFLGGWD